MEAAIATIALIVFLVLTLRTYFAAYPKKDFNPVKLITRVGIFGAFSAILYVVEVFSIHLPFFPNFLALHFDEIPAFIAGFAYGPWAGIAVIAIKTVIKLPFSSTLLVGELCDLILSSIYVFIVTFIYKRKRNLKGVAIGFAIGSVVQVISAMLLNVYAMIPFYLFLYQMKPESLLGIMRAAVPAISDIGWSYAFLAVLPFNILKDAIVVILTFIIYRSIHKQLRFAKIS